MNQIFGQTSSLIRVNRWPKSSFDRFSDDLTELILGFLPIEDKFRFECLNKRVQTMIFKKQNKLKLCQKRRVAGYSDQEEVVGPNTITDFNGFNGLERGVKKLEWLTRVDIEWFNGCRHDLLKCLAGSRVKHLKVWGHSVGNTMLSHIVHMQYLRSVKLVDFTYEWNFLQKSFNESMFVNYFGQLKFLQSLIISPKRMERLFVSGRTIGQMLVKCQYLRRLVLKFHDNGLYSYSFTENSLTAFKREALRKPNEKYYLQIFINSSIKEEVSRLARNAFPISDNLTVKINTYIRNI